jgi:predicted acetyltransferase
VGWDREDLPGQSMTNKGDMDSPLVEVIAAAHEQEPILANLLELYLHDFSAFLDLDIGEDGRFGYASLPLYWSERGRYPFLIRMDGKLAGLALVKKGPAISGSDAVWDMAEFFVVRGCRGRGVGTLAAHQVWRRFPGQWEVRVMQRNTLARRFWAGAISTFVGEAIQPVRLEKDGEAWDLFSFQSRQVDA